MIPRPARYLLRFDDLCPTMSRSQWQRFLPTIEKFGIRPILAVVPCNSDPELQIDEPDPMFWDRMRAMEAAGATIGLHGYRHVCASRGRSLVPFHRTSEFAGVPEDTQRQWIRQGLGILRCNGLNPRIWVAPRHGFDRCTLRILREEGIGLVSDGLARAPFIREGLTWIPQQLWAPAGKGSGLWTILMHPNTAPDALVDQLEKFVREHHAQFASVDRVFAEFHPSEFGLADRFFEASVLLRRRLRQVLKPINRPG